MPGDVGSSKKIEEALFFDSRLSPRIELRQ
jgi:hypothetical protein